MPNSITTGRNLHVVTATEGYFIDAVTKETSAIRIFIVELYRYNTGMRPLNCLRKGKCHFMP